MDLKKEFDSLHNFFNTDAEMDSSEIQQTKYCSGKSQTFKNEQDDVLDDPTFNILKFQTTEQFAHDEMIGEIIECVTSKSEQRSDSPTKIVQENVQSISKLIKQEFEHTTSDVRVTEIKQEVSECVQLKTEGELSELLTSHCDLPTLKMEISDCLDNLGHPCNSKSLKNTANNFTSSMLKSAHMEGFTQAHLIEDSDETPSKCDMRFKKFKHKSNLQKHLLIHSDEKPFKCDVCSKIFTQKSDLQKHLRIHSGEKPFKCDVCFKRFTQKYYLQKHLIIHNGDEKPFKCNICSKGFSLKSNLQKHLTIHSCEKPFTCDICSKGFSLKSNLQTHLTIHSDENPFKCNICSKRFNRKCNFQAHLRIHSGEKPFKCNICSKGFSVKSSLERHLRIHSDENLFK